MRLLFLLSTFLLATNAIAQSDRDWIQLFNGEDLSNWQIKFTGYPLGHNLHDTFRVEDGLFKVSYENWDGFNGEFGHIYTEQSFSHYRLRVEYRFVAEQVTDGPAWAFRNNGIMFHSQAAETVALDQEFPVSIEAQMLGGNGSDARPNGNVCSPGTHIEMRGELITQHCNNSNSATFHGDDWVTMEIEVLGSESVKHWLDGELVLEYGGIQLDTGDPDAQALLANGAAIELSEGHIAMQAETHPIHFRKIELLPIE